MSFYDLYLGHADDPKFKWDGGEYAGNIPSIIVKFGSIGLMGCVRARTLLESPAYGGRVLDWGASGAKLSKARVAEFLREFYGGTQRDEMLRRIEALRDDREYLLFACEE